MTTNDEATITIDDYDAGVLYTIPEPGGDLRTILMYYVSTNRAPCPSYEEINATLTKARKAGIVAKDGSQYTILSEWYSRIHAHDESACNEIDSMIQFEEDISGVPLSIVSPTIEPIAREEYENAVSQLIMR